MYADSFPSEIIALILSADVCLDTWGSLGQFATSLDGTLGVHSSSIPHAPVLAGTFLHLYSLKYFGTYAHATAISSCFATGRCCVDCSSSQFCSWQ